MWPSPVHPLLSWVKQQLREATPWGECPRSLLHDNDGIDGQRSRRPGEARRRVEKRYRCTLDHWLDQAMGIEGVPTPSGAPNAAAHLERFMGTLRCLPASFARGIRFPPTRTVGS